jgi:nucleoside-diphosphate-sugar epimerase
MSSVVTTRNLLEAAAKNDHLRRFVNVSSFTVYSTRKIRRGGMLDESCEMEKQPQRRGEAYCYAKVRQDEIVMEYWKSHKVPYVIVRPGVVYGPGNKGITGRVGLGTFGLFLHLGGSNKIPLTYVDNCADAIALAGIKGGVDREVFNVVDDDLPTSRKFLGMYKKNVRRFHSVYVPRGLAFLLCCAWEKYSDWSKGQLQPVFNRKMYGSYWKGNRYSNEKLKKLLGWNPRVPFREASRRYFEYQKEVGAEK